MTGAHGVILRCGKILLIERGVQPFLGYWGIPGGGQEEGETLAETVKREIAEETGLEVNVVEKIGELVGAISGTPQHIFLCKPLSASLKPSLPEVTDVKWVAYEELSGLRIVPFLKDLLISLKLEILEKQLSR